MWHTHSQSHPTKMSLKRSMSDSECEDDLFSDTKDSSDHTNSSTTISCGHGHTNRKKRRGIIEKRRRDRINNSLTELRRLVPTAFEKQGSAKLEKAEILQMTVDHLKMLHAKGLDALSYDPHKFAMDYHSIGFRECATEIARYLVTQEGMDIQDPMRLRLMSHLQCFAAQRELANKQASASTWGVGVGVGVGVGLNSLTAAAAVNQHSTAATPYSHHFNSGSSMEAGSPMHAHAVAQQQQQYNYGTPTSHLIHTHAHTHTSPSMPNESLLNNSQHLQQQQQGSYGSGSSGGLSSGSASFKLEASPASVASSMSSGVLVSHYHHHHQGLLGGPGGVGVGVGVGGNNNSYIPNGKPPHRPWGAELAY